MRALISHGTGGGKDLGAPGFGPALRLRLLVGCRLFQVGPGGLAEIDLLARDFFVTGEAGAGAADPSAIDFSGHQKNFEDAVRSLKRGDKPFIDGTEARKSIEDERLSWAARGLLGYLLSKPDDWKVLVNDLECHQVDHVLIPEYNLSHYLKSAHKLFIGAVLVTSDNQAVTGSGTANVVSLCHWYHVPVYLFAESIKFTPKSLPDQLIYYEEQDKTEVDFNFHLKTFSHDFIDLAMVDHIITEMGEITRPAK